jgi:hypothetical protein
MSTVLWAKLDMAASTKPVRHLLPSGQTPKWNSTAGICKEGSLTVTNYKNQINLSFNGNIVTVHLMIFTYLVTL